jgi:hypothetical protein
MSSGSSMNFAGCWAYRGHDNGAPVYLSTGSLSVCSRWCKMKGLTSPPNDVSPKRSPLDGWKDARSDDDTAILAGPTNCKPGPKGARAVGRATPRLCKVGTKVIRSVTRSPPKATARLRPTESQGRGPTPHTRGAGRPALFALALTNRQGISGRRKAVAKRKPGVSAPRWGL